MNVQFGGIYKLNFVNTTPQHKPEDQRTFKNDIDTIASWRALALDDAAVQRGHISGQIEDNHVSQLVIDKTTGKPVGLHRAKNLDDVDVFVLVNDERGNDNLAVWEQTRPILENTLQQMEQADDPDEKRRLSGKVIDEYLMDANPFAAERVRGAQADQTVETVDIPIVVDPSGGYIQDSEYFQAIYELDNQEFRLARRAQKDQEAPDAPKVYRAP